MVGSAPFPSLSGTNMLWGSPAAGRHLGTESSNRPSGLQNLSVSPGLLTHPTAHPAQMVVHGDELFLYGGHSIAQQPGGSEVETVYDDMWRLDLKIFEARASDPVASKTWLWLSGVASWWRQLPLMLHVDQKLAPACACDAFDIQSERRWQPGTLSTGFDHGCGRHAPHLASVLLAFLPAFCPLQTWLGRGGLSAAHAASASS